MKRTAEEERQMTSSRVSVRMVKHTARTQPPAQTVMKSESVQMKVKRVSSRTPTPAARQGESSRTPAPAARQGASSRTPARTADGRLDVADHSSEQDVRFASLLPGHDRTGK